MATDRRDGVAVAMQNAGRILAEAAGVVLVAAALLAMGFQVGRDAGRIDALRAEEAGPRVTITKKQAAARIDPICRRVVQRATLNVQRGTRR